LYTIMSKIARNLFSDAQMTAKCRTQASERRWILNIVHTTLRLCRLHLKSTQASLIARSTTACSAVRLLIVRHTAQQNRAPATHTRHKLTRHGNCRQALTYENGGVHVVDVPLGAVLVLLQETLHHEQNPEKHICTPTMHPKQR
jgi:hypothetical protein